MQHREDRSAIGNGRVQIRRNSADDQPSYPVLNISRGGLCFQSADSYELNEVVELDISLDSKPLHHASARICYRNQTDGSSSASYGLSFLDHFIDADLIRQR